MTEEKNPPAHQTEEKKGEKAKTKAKKDEKVVMPSWIKMKPDEIKEIIVKFANEGKSPSQIGLVLRDKYGVPKTKLLGKSIREILEESQVQRSGRRIYHNPFLNNCL